MSVRALPKRILQRRLLLLPSRDRVALRHEKDLVRRRVARRRRDGRVRDGHEEEVLLRLFEGRLGRAGAGRTSVHDGGVVAAGAIGGGEALLLGAKVEAVVRRERREEGTEEKGGG